MISHYATGEVDGKFSVNVRELLHHSPCYSVYLHSH